MASFTAVQESVSGPADTKAPFAGAVLDVQPGGVGGGGGLTPPFLLQELIMNANPKKTMILFLYFISSLSSFKLLDLDEIQLFTTSFCVGLSPKFSCMKKILITIVLSLSLIAKTMADEGMWLPLLLGQVWEHRWYK